MKALTKLFRSLGIKRYGYAELRGAIAFQHGVPLIHEKGRKLNGFLCQMVAKNA
jgi:hypothetical protein